MKELFITLKVSWPWPWHQFLRFTYTANFTPIQSEELMWTHVRLRRSVEWVDEST